jgi:hypothetical protein
MGVTVGPDGTVFLANGRDGLRTYSYRTVVHISNETDYQPEKFHLHENYPNPFNPITTIKYSLPEAGSVQLLILNILGQEIMKLQNEVQAPGNYEVQWNGLDQTGKPVDTGVYFARLEAGNYSETIKMVYLK